MNHLLSIILLFISIVSLSQEKEQRGVLVSNSEKNNSYLVIEGFMVKVFTKDTKIYKGVLGIHDANTIMVNKDQIKLTEIIEFRGNDRQRNVLGKTIMLSGAGLFAAAMITFIITGDDALNIVNQVMIIAGAVGVAGISAGAAIYADKRNFKASDGWTYQISGPLE